MISTLTKLAQKPTDTTIRIIRIVFALILIAVIYFGWSVTVVNFGLPQELKYGLYIFPAIGLIRGVFDPGIMRKKAWKWTIVTLGALMLIISLVFIDDVVPATAVTRPAQVASGSTQAIDIGSLIAQAPQARSFTLSTDNWFGFFGVVLIIMGLLLNGKNITTKNERHAEVIKKIRV